MKYKCCSLVCAASRFTQRVALPALFVTAALALTTTVVAQAPPGSLWYDGDWNGVNGLANERNTVVSQAAVYDDFNVTSPSGWHVTAVFSDNLENTIVIGADWEIRSGIAEGNGGTLVASGTTNAPIVTPTGRGGELVEYMVEVNGLDVFLPALPQGQHYWLNVTPIGNGSGASFNSSTFGDNCVGTPCGNDDNAFFNSTTFGALFDHSYNQCTGCVDFSMGVIGTVVPEPATIALITCGAAALLVPARRSRGAFGIKDRRGAKMKTKMNIARIFCALWATAIFLSGIPQSRGQTTEQRMDTSGGYEPIVNCDRRTDSEDLSKRVQYLWTDGTTIYRAISHNLGATWVGLATFQSGIDPFATSDIWSTNPSVPRIMYFGWLNTSGNTQADYFARSLSGTDVDSGPEVANNEGNTDRPWLAVDTANLYLSIGGATGVVKRAAIPSGTNTVRWDLFSAVDVFDPSATTSLISNFPIAAHIDSDSNEKVFALARQYITDQTQGCTETAPLQNAIRIKRSTDQGSTWAEVQAIDVDGIDGFPFNRDRYMATDHVSSDPRTSVNYVYAFYVRNEAAPYLNCGGKRNVLYCAASLDGGSHWNGGVRVFAFNAPPQNCFGSVPLCHSTDNGTGFFRIGRVWSSIDDNGNIYVAWMDNRYGVYSGDSSKDYWQVFCSRSTNQGDTWSTPIQVSGSSGDLGTASIGCDGYGGCRGNHIPPGDFISCDADNNRLYVAWPDSRATQDGPISPVEAYFRRIDFQ